MSPENLPATPWPARLGLAAMTVIRMLLAIGMMPYAISKLWDVQFQVTGFNYSRPLADANGKILTWAMMGYSPRFQMLMGLLEFIPAVLLLNVRTRRIGALLMFPVVLNVFLINIFMDLWPTTQVISGVLLAFDVFLIAYDLRLYLAFFRSLLAPPVRIASRRLRITARVLAFVLPVGFITVDTFFFVKDMKKRMSPIADFIGERQINRAGTWKVASLVVAGKPVDVPAIARVWFGFGGHCTFGTVVDNSDTTYKVDAAHHTIHIDHLSIGGSSAPIEAAYRVSGDHLQLEATRDGQPFALTLIQDNWGRVR